MAKFDSIHEAKTNLSRLIERACAGGKLLLLAAKRLSSSWCGSTLKCQPQIRGHEGTCSSDSRVFRALTGRRISSLGPMIVWILLDTHAFLWWLDGILTCLHLPIPDLRDRNGARAHLSVDASFAYGGRRFRSVVSGETRRMPPDGRYRRI